MREYKLVRSKRKSLAIEVTERLEVIVRAPFFISEGKIEEFIALHENWIEKAVEKIKVKQRSRPPQPSEEQIKILKQKAKEILPQRTAFYSEIVGLTPTAVKITSAKTRFGSCSGKKAFVFLIV